MYVLFLVTCDLGSDYLFAVISRMQQVNIVVEDINAQAKQSATSYEVSLDDFSPLFSQFLVQFPVEFDRYRLDEIVVAAIAPLVSSWFLLMHVLSFH